MRALLLVFVCLLARASELPSPPHLAVPRKAEAPSMAADADLSTWEGALVIREFTMIMPDDKGTNRWPTIAHILWGPDALYVAIQADDPEPHLVRGFRHKRDDFSGDQDFVGIDLDPTGKGQGSIRLFVTPLGGQFDGLISDTTGEDYSYDLMWDSVGLRTPTGYLVKLRVPYSSLRRDPGEWGFRILRIIPRERRYGIVWPKVSRDIQCDQCQLAKVAGAPESNTGAPFLVIPTASASRVEGLVGPARTETRLGLDLRYAGRAVTLEGTYKPDFNAVDADVDPLQINSRFKVFYPEKRPFFLEGMDLLGVQGAQRQFFSRAIADPLYGVKASGTADFATWTVLHAKDVAGGRLLEDVGAAGVADLPTRDTAAAMRFRLDDRGSAFSVLGTDKLLLGGPERSGGQSGGLYLNQVIGTEWRVVASGLRGVAHLPQSDGSVLSTDGSATSVEVDWDSRRWSAFGVSQATSPGLVLASGFTDLQGYRNTLVGGGFHDNWNEGFVARTNAFLKVRDLTWWNGRPLERALNLDSYTELLGRWSLGVLADLAGRTWLDDRPDAPNVAIRNLKLTLGWRRLSWAQVSASVGGGRTLDYTSGVPARYRTAGLSSSGSFGSVAYSLDAKRFELAREVDGARLVRARQLVATATWQLPAHVYVKTQSYVVRYDGLEADGTDKYLKVLLGWQPNAFTGAYLGWSGQRQRDPSEGIPAERMTERGLFAKVAYALQF
ncbi:MAG TPA: DUF5916 domain-containing protein [Holophagaceae bacterium]|nr:DUF5916 domain-containing protein [Holophagaceae bacterium]